MEFMLGVPASTAVRIRIGDAEFHPAFTHPLYGPEERIVGYKQPEVVIEFEPKSLLAVVHAKYESKDENAPDLVSPVLDKMSKDTFTDRAKWLQECQKVQSSFTGTEIAQFDNYIVYKSSISESSDFLMRMRIFVLLFIDAGSYIDMDDDAWELFYVVTKDTSEFVGFSAVYPYFFYRNGKEFEETGASGHGTDVRKRISQFFVLPSFYRQKVGSNLYDSLVQKFWSEPQTKEFTVEEPNEAFDDLRDRQDMRLLESRKEWRDIKQPLSKTALVELASKLKMDVRQVQRCLEMQLVLESQREDNAAVLNRVVKNKIYQKNYDSLVSLDEKQTKEALEATFQRIVTDYERILGVSRKKRKAPPV